MSRLFLTGALLNGTSALTVSQTVATTGSPTAVLITGAAHTTLAASTEAPDLDVSLNRTVQFATGTLATQRAVVFRAPTYGFVASSTLTTAATVAIDAAPVQGTNATITNAYALWVQTGRVWIADTTAGTTTNGALIVGNGVGSTSVTMGNGILNVGGVSLLAGSVTCQGTNTLTLTQASYNAVIRTALFVTPANGTLLTASTESVQVAFQAHTLQWATTVPVTQRAVRFQAPTYSCDTAANTITTAATVAITAAPIAGTNVAITNAYALWVQAGNVAFSPNTDSVLLSGYGSFGLATSGTSTAFYVAQAGNFTSTSYALLQTNVGNTVLNAASGQSVFIRVNNANSPSAVTVGGTSVVFGAGYPVTVNDKATVVGGSITLSNGTSNLITYNTNGVAAPAFTTISAGMKIALYNDVDATHTGLGIGIESNYVWFASSISTNGFKWYQGTTEKMRMAPTTGALLINQTTDDTATKLQVTGGLNVDGIKSLKVSRTLDLTTIGNTVNIGSYAQNSEGAWIRVRINGTCTNTVQMKEWWIYSTAWPTQLGWIEVPLHGGRGFNGQGEISLDARQQTTSGTVAIELRLRAASSNAAGNISLTVYLESAQVFTPDTTTGTGATVVSGYLSQPGYQFPAAVGVWNNSSAGMFISSAGRVSIGTTTDDGTNALQVTGSAVVNQVVATSGSPVGMKFVGAAHTTLAASTEAIDVYVNCARTVQFATSTPTTQRAVFIAAPTYSCDTAAQTITTAATLTINAAPAAGTNVTITNPYALWVQGGVTKFADATVAGSAATGAVVVTGSVGIGNRCWVGSNLITDAALHQSVATITTTGSITSSQGLILVDATSGNIVLTLPAAATFSTHSQDLTIVRIDASANTVTVQRAGSNTLNGGTAGILMPATVGFTVSLRSDASTAWYMSTTGVGSIGGSIASNQVAYGSGANTIQGSATLTYTATTGLALAPTAVATGVQTAVLVTGAANTNLTLSTEVIDVNLALNRTVQWATGGLTTQRAVVVQAPTYGFVGASTIATAATFAISGAPAQGTNATITKALALWVQAGLASFDGGLTSTTLTSTVATGTSPLTVASTTLVANLNAALLNSQNGAFYQNASNLNAGLVPLAQIPTRAAGAIRSLMLMGA